MSGWAVDAHDDAIVIEDRVQPERWLVVLVLKLHAAIDETDHHHEPTIRRAVALIWLGLESRA